ncbi:28S rRNA (cytosine-C(5))-methyltransferase [Culex pipiens pallens]|uniref:28S rRNA (cytosine-C(5))-methyltransferase n=1 Tax=Culex pipiens pallens TaxID=42434 RepID=UPI001952A37C|nr:28S rRNA (cytosine-C(5))-methyltransferase [Culex pipiens pallens]XP_052562147.1 28S rRNA (cytosine-C(5))-methyltransferase [Culex pipiens pallens]
MVVEQDSSPPAVDGTGQQDQQQQPQQRRHKIPVPTNYRSASKILRLVVEERRNVKSLVLEDKHLRKGKGLAMMDLILVNLTQIKDLVRRTELLEKEPRLNPWLATVLVAELIFGRKELTGDSLPVQCVRRYREALQEALTTSEVAPAKQLDFKEPRYVRINVNMLAPPGAIRLLQEEGWVLVDEEFASYAEYLERVRNLGDSEFLVDFHFKEMLVFPNSAKNYWARATDHKQKFVLQNKACLLPTYLLNPAKKSVVMDMCAAPGLKTTHLANLMKNKGRVYAVERDANRYKLLCDYSADFGVIKTINDDCLLVGDEQAPGVEYILLDPSCSGSGMVDRLKLNEEIDKQRLYRLGGLQYKLLTHAMNAFPAAKRIVYSTCSIFPEENEAIVQGALRHNGHWKLVDAKAALGKEWHNVGSPDFPGIGEKCLYARPESDLTIGMFVAVLERCEGEDEVNEVYLAHEKQKDSYEKLARIGKEGGGKEKGKRRRKQEVGGEEEEGSQAAPEESVNEDEPSKKKKKKKSKELVEEENQQTEEVAEAQHEESSLKKKKKKDKKVESAVEEQDVAMPEDCTQDDDDKISKKKKKKNKNKEVEEPEVVPEESTVDEQDVSSVKKKKKKKNKDKSVEEIVE